jgi:hypothetical protein
MISLQPVSQTIWRPTLLPTAQVFYWPGNPNTLLQERSSPTTISQIGNDVGTVRNLGALGGNLIAQTADSNRGTLAQDVRRCLRGSATVGYAQTFAAATPAVIYTVAAFKTPSSQVSYERLASVAESAIAPDFADGASGVALLLRELTSMTWGVWRNNFMRQGVTIAASTRAVVETICESTQTTVCRDGGVDAVASHAALTALNVSSLRMLCGHQSGGAYGSSSSSDVFALAVFFLASAPSADFRSRCRAEARICMGSV